MTASSVKRRMVPQDKLSALAISVVGLGAIGRQAALQLASLGAKHLQLIDFDDVEFVNVTTQGYRRDDIGLPKVSAAGRQIMHIDREIEVEIVRNRFRSKQRVGDAMFCCVDSISARRAI